MVIQMTGYHLRRPICGCRLKLLRDQAGGVLTTRGETMPKRIRKQTPSDRERIADAKAAAASRRAMRDMDDAYMAGVRIRLGHRAASEPDNWPLQRQWITRRWGTVA